MDFTIRTLYAAAARAWNALPSFVRDGSLSTATEDSTPQNIFWRGG